MQTGERQTARLRLQYLEAVLRKDINFFDMEAKDSNILYHISSDAILVQDAIGDKVYGERNLYAFVFSIPVVIRVLLQLIPLMHCRQAIPCATFRNSL